MNFTTRRTNNPDDLAFALPVCDAILWEPVSTGDNAVGSVWRTSVTLTDIPEQHIIVPSFACLTGLSISVDSAQRKTSRDLRANARDTCRHRTLAWFREPNPERRAHAVKNRLLAYCSRLCRCTGRAASLPAARINRPGTRSADVKHQTH